MSTRFSAFSVLALSLLMGRLQAQSTLGTITGLIADSSGAVIPNAVVVATNKATGAQAQTISSSTGNYVIPNLQVGPYQVSATVSGFRAWTRSGINVSSNDNLRIDITVEVGDTTERVSVSAEGASAEDGIHRFGAHRLAHPEHDITVQPFGQNWGDKLGGAVRNNPGFNTGFPAVS